LYPISWLSAKPNKHKQTTQEQNEKKIKPKSNENLNQQSSLMLHSIGLVNSYLPEIN